MEHIFKEVSSERPVLLLLHGTGGTEKDLLPLASMIDPEAPVLSVRGNVLENGMPRFFKRLREGVFDEEDLIYRTKELNSFLDEASEKYGFDRHNITAVGYSNGANIAASLLYHDKDALSAAVLHHAMVPLKNVDLPDLTGKRVFLAAGTNDPLIPKEQAEELAAVLEKAGASVKTHWESAGHQLTGSEVNAAGLWYRNND
ncbi:alpha/beta hydrolase [Alkalicoccus saliphilus]|uniref:Carboxylesterase n=1 Tax=Alkalicoccus saliphilus TaxID=200989 RepID=A0A2T4U9P2_9BACI|nr:alpha/beta hydrolase [Alkalicoccus saliphilus]PTL40115.1 carboxylesterase [Alkalicoccus saliphilus]